MSILSRRAGLRNSVHGPVSGKQRVEIANLVGNQWWARCLLATENDQLGMILRSVMGMPTDLPPWFGPSAIIDQRGIVLTNYVDENNRAHVGVAVCHIDDLVNNLRRLCDTLDISDVHAHALFSQVRGWIKTDARPATEQAEDRVPIEYRTVQ